MCQHNNDKSLRKEKEGLQALALSRACKLGRQKRAAADKQHKKGAIILGSLRGLRKQVRQALPEIPLWGSLTRAEAWQVEKVQRKAKKLVARNRRNGNGKQSRGGGRKARASLDEDAYAMWTPALDYHLEAHSRWTAAPAVAVRRAVTPCAGWRTALATAQRHRRSNTAGFPCMDRAPKPATTDQLQPQPQPQAQPQPQPQPQPQQKEDEKPPAPAPKEKKAAQPQDFATAVTVTTERQVRRRCWAARAPVRGSFARRRRPLPAASSTPAPGSTRASRSRTGTRKACSSAASRWSCGATGAAATWRGCAGGWRMLWWLRSRLRRPGQIPGWQQQRQRKRRRWLRRRRTRRRTRRTLPLNQQRTPPSGWHGPAG